MYPRVFLLLALIFAISSGSIGNDDDATREKKFEQTIKISSVPNVSLIQQERFVVPVLEQIAMLPAPETTAAIVSVITLGNNRIQLQFHERDRHPIASITKLMTAIIAEELIGGETRITMQEDDVATEGPAGDFAINEIYSINDLIKAMLAVSANDAATAMARTVGTKKFVDAMQQKARALRMENTTFFDPTGLSPLNQSTAEDLRALMVTIRRDHQNLLRMTRAASVTIMNQRDGQFRVLKNINEFAGREEFEGGKTGYTEEARGNLVSLFTIDNEQLLMIVLGSSDRFGDTRTLYDWAKKVLQ